jgi:hypothetical protein
MNDSTIGITPAEKAGFVFADTRTRKDYRAQIVMRIFLNNLDQTLSLEDIRKEAKRYFNEEQLSNELIRRTVFAMFNGGFSIRQEFRLDRDNEAHVRQNLISDHYTLQVDGILFETMLDLVIAEAEKSEELARSLAEAVPGLLYHTRETEEEFELRVA